MRKNIQTVIAAFIAGRAAKGDSKNTCSTDGTTIYSYAMPIAWREDDGGVVIVEYSKAPSNTTRSQVRACQLAIKCDPIVVIAAQAIQERG